jgi:hypothetical protein
MRVDVVLRSPGLENSGCKIFLRLSISDAAPKKRAAAARATNERAAQSHRELAKQYKGLANGIELPRLDASDGDEGALSKDFRIVP